MRWSHTIRSAAVGAMLLGLAGPLAAQQTGRITGRIVDAATNRPLAGVQVFLPPTGIGGLTDGDGRFLLLNVPAGQHTLTAQIVGFRQGERAVTVTAGETTIANVGLTQTAIELDQIVVTGAGVATQKKKLGNTIATIDVSRLENAPISDFSQILQGREPGVVALPSSGSTGEGARIRIRGSASLSQLNEPVVYVDGIRVDRSAANAFNDQANPSRLDDIPPDAIERVEILKGAAAATLYGTEASNGVIQIFTKKGRAGAPRFTFQVDQTAVSVPTNRMLPLADFAETQTDVNRIRDRWGLQVRTFEPFQIDLLPGYFDTGYQQVYSASVSGGADFFTYFASARFQDENGPFAIGNLFPDVEGYEKADDQNRRVQTTANLTVSPHEKVRIGVNTLYAEMDHETPDNGNNIYGAFSSTLMSQLRLANENNLYGQPAFATLRENIYQQNKVETNHFAGSVNVNYSPFQTIKVDGTFGVDFVNESGTTFRPFRWNLDNFSTSTPEGTRTADEIRNRVLTADLKFSWDYRVSDDLTSTFLAGGQGFLNQRTFRRGSGTRFPGPGLEVTDAGADQSVNESWVRNVQVGGYLQDQIGFKDYAFVTVGGRWDANSAFGEKFSTAFYPKVSLSFIPTQAFGWTNETFSTVRVRGAIGKSGLQPSAFDKFTTYTPQPSVDGPGVAPSNLGNDALKPEVSTEWEAGAELGLFNDRASIEFTYWDRQVIDALVARQFPVTGGFVRTQLDNIGKTEAHGIDLGVRGNVFQSENFSVSVFANGAFLNEKVVDMGGAPPLKTGGSYPRYRNFIVEGYSPAAFFGAKLSDAAIPLNIDGTCREPTRAAALQYFATPRNPSAFKPLAVGNSDFGTPNGAFASHNCGNGLLLSWLGKPTPDWQGSFGLNVSFLGDFEVNSLFEYKAGDFYVQDLSGMFRRANAVIGRNTPRSAQLDAIIQNPASTPEQRLDAAIAWVNEVEGLAPMSGLNGVYPADFIRWRELSLTYRVPTSFVDQLGLASAAITLGGRNLALWVNDQYPGMDPEGNVNSRCNGGLDCNFLDSTEGWGIPIPRRYSLSMRVSF